MTYLKHPRYFVAFGFLLFAATRVLASELSYVPSINTTGPMIADESSPNNPMESFPALLLNLLTLGCYLGALAFAVTGVDKWLSYKKNPILTPFKFPILYWCLAVMLAGLPAFMSAGVNTTWSDATPTKTAPSANSEGAASDLLVQSK